MVVSVLSGCPSVISNVYLYQFLSGQLTIVREPIRVLRLGVPNFLDDPVRVVGTELGPLPRHRPLGGFGARIGRFPGDLGEGRGLDSTVHERQ